jgi:hypothetical protein
MNTNSGIMGAIIGGVTATASYTLEIATCRYCGRDITRRYRMGYWRHDGNNIFCYKKRKVKRHKNCIATPESEADEVIRILKEYK